MSSRLIKLFYNMNVLLAVVVITLPAVFFFCTPVIIFDLLSWTKETASWSDDSRLPQKVVSTELQSRMKSFLMRYSSADIPLDNDFVIASHLSSTQSHGLIHLTYVGDVQNVGRSPFYAVSVNCLYRVRDRDRVSGRVTDRLRLRKTCAR